jgi:hypothetical protein
MWFKAWMHNINHIDQDVIKTLLYLTQNCKLGMKNVKNKKIDQHKNATCQMQSLEKTLTLMSLAPFILFAFKTFSS